MPEPPASLAHGVDRKLGSDSQGSLGLPILERNAGAVSELHDGVERRDRRARIDEAGIAD